MGQQSGTSLNLSDGFGAYSRWGRPAAAHVPGGAARPTMARDEYQRARVADTLAKPVGYGHLRPGCSKPPVR